MRLRSRASKGAVACFADDELIHPTLIGPRSKLPRVFTFHLKLADAQRVRDGDIKPIVNGKAVYDDVFRGKTHITKFCARMRYEPAIYGEAEFGFFPCEEPKSNCADEECNEDQ
jgi:hypothetical protein